MGQLRQFRNLDIDWNMEPADAVALYLEWGNTGYGGSYECRVKSTDDHSNYFVVYNWDDGLKVFLVRRDSCGAEDLAELPLPRKLGERFQNEVGHNHGVYPITEEIKGWLEAEMYN